MDPQDINYLGFNQDQTCLSVGTQSGFKVFSTESFALLHQEDCGAVSLIEMLFRTSLLALVGCSGGSTSSSSKELTMWNTKERCNICQLRFSAGIHGVRMNHRRIVVLLKQKIHIFDLRTTKSLHIIDRTLSPWMDPSIGWLCAASERGYLATPISVSGGSAASACHAREGGLQASAQKQPCIQDVASPRASPRGCSSDREALSKQLSKTDEDGEGKLGFVSLIDTYTLKTVGTVLAHRTPIRALCLNPTGQLLATASVKGTVVRLFGVPSFDMLYSFRRGATTCQIFGILFSRDSAHICTSAASGTVHVFRNSQEVLGSLPLASEEATVGAARREMLSRAGATGEPATEGGGGPAALLGVGAPPSEQAALGGSGPESVLNNFDTIAADAEDLGDWHVVTERPERVLELAMNIPSYGSTSSRVNALQVLSAVSDYALDSSVKYAKSLLQLLPQPCREMLDAPRAFAWIHLRENAGKCGSEAPVPKLPQHEEVLTGPGWLPEVQGGQGMYTACITSKPGPSEGSSEVFIATCRGCVHVYEWNMAAGGEGRLCSEHSLASQQL